MQSLAAAILSLAAAGSCRFWSIEAIEYNNNTNENTANDSNENNDKNNAAVADMEDLNVFYLYNNNNTNNTVTSATIGFFVWNPDNRGCRRFRGALHLTATTNGDPTIKGSSLGWKAAPILASAAAAVAFLGLVSVCAELLYPHGYRSRGGRSASIALALLAAATQASAMFAIFLSDVCPDSDFECAIDLGAIFAMVAIVFWLVMSCTIGVLDVQKARQKSHVAEMAEVGSHGSKKRKSKAKKGWTISLEPQADEEMGASSSSSSSEEDVFFDVDRDFIGHEIVVPLDFVDSDVPPPEEIPVRQKQKPILYPPKVPFTNSSDLELRDNHQVHASNKRKYRTYKAPYRHDCCCEFRKL